MILTYLFFSLAFSAIATWIRRSTSKTRGPGSWAEDRMRLMVAGSLYTVGLVFVGLMLAEILLS